MTPLFRRSTFGLSLLCAALAAALCTPARAADAPADAAADETPGLSWSAFGTVGLAVSDQPWRYQRYLSRRVSGDRDSVFGLQADIELTPHWSATVQARLAPAANHDSRWDLRTTWAFAAWRPSNDWLVRVGKLRVPFLMRSEQQDVGQTYDELRLPADIYTLPPTSDYGGAHVTRNVSMGGADLGIDAYAGRGSVYKRGWIRAAVPSPVPGAPDLLAAGATFRKADVTVSGLVLTWREPERLLRAGLHRIDIRRSDGVPIIRQPVWDPTLGYWQTDNALPGPGVAEVPRFQEWMITLGADQALPGNWRVAGELVRIRQIGTQVAVDAWGSYGTLYRNWGAFTPYATLAATYSTPESAQWARALDTTTVNAAIPGAAVLNAGMRATADATLVFRQHSLALGTSYALSPRSKLKVEWMQARSRISQLVDVPAGEPLEKPRHVNVLSAAYSFVF